MQDGEQELDWWVQCCAVLRCAALHADSSSQWACPLSVERPVCQEDCCNEHLLAGYSY